MMQRPSLKVFSAKASPSLGTRTGVDGTRSRAMVTPRESEEWASYVAPAPCYAAPKPCYAVPTPMHAMTAASYPTASHLPQGLAGGRPVGASFVAQPPPQMCATSPAGSASFVAQPP